MSNLENKKSYYAIIPADVRYDKSLKANAKLLYGEITALCNEKGYCWANNNYFSELYEVGAQTISRWISDLHNKGYIRVEILKTEGNQRHIWITQKAIPLAENDNTLLIKNAIPIAEKSKHNNTSNSTSNNTNISIEQVNKLWSLYPKKKGKGTAITKIPKLIKKYGYEQIERCIQRYTLETKDKDMQYIKEGSTFFNTGYVDYLDENYKPEVKPVVSRYEPI